MRAVLGEPLPLSPHWPSRSMSAPRGSPGRHRWPTCAQALVCAAVFLLFYAFEPGFLGE
ncbi:hypothetical protein [Nonomuraea sp. NPDC049504]|uniref:hypothetical protein n=1 Tax=Nonomuraea sp. NPDC049504 TaxID=3154729 RepID=UPI00341BFB40